MKACLIQLLVGVMLVPNQFVFTQFSGFSGVLFATFSQYVRQQERAACDTQVNLIEKEVSQTLNDLDTCKLNTVSEEACNVRKAAAVATALQNANAALQQQLDDCNTDCDNRLATAVSEAEANANPTAQEDLANCLRNACTRPTVIDQSGCMTCSPLSVPDECTNNPSCTSIPIGLVTVCVAT